jgi:DNA (cytosine-5)-methyltransferase 1
MRKKNIKICDLFAGIGGIRLGFQQAAGDLDIDIECVYTSEIDRYSIQTYRKNYPNDNHHPFSDITKIDEKQLPDFDVLLAGFPCQAFSIAGKRGGFNDTRGTLFFDVARIIREKQPSAFLLENVKGLISHDGGKTLGTILNVLQNDLNYSTQFSILNAKDFGLAQNRERIYIVGFKNTQHNFKYPEATDNTKRIRDILEQNAVAAKYYLSEKYIEAIIRHKERHQSKGHGFGYQIKSNDDIANSVVCGGMGLERNLLIDFRQKDLTPTTHKGKTNTDGIRRMTPIEWERLQGFPDNWTDAVSDTRRYRQLGNSVAVPVIKSVVSEIIKEII